MQNNPYVSSPGTVAAAALKDSTKNVYLCTDMIRLPFVASSRFKIAKLICCSSPTAVEIISLRYHLKVHTVLILCFNSNIIDLSIFIDVYSCFLSIYWFSIVLLFGCIPLLPISSPSNLSWLNPYISTHCNTLSSSQSDIRNPSLQFCWQGLASLLAHEHSRFAICQWELSTATDRSIPPAA